MFCSFVGHGVAKASERDRGKRVKEKEGSRPWGELSHRRARGGKPGYAGLYLLLGWRLLKYMGSLLT